MSTATNSPGVRACVRETGCSYVCMCVLCVCLPDVCTVSVFASVPVSGDCVGREREGGGVSWVRR